MIEIALKVNVPTLYIHTSINLSQTLIATPFYSLSSVTVSADMFVFPIPPLASTPETVKEYSAP